MCVPQWCASLSAHCCPASFFFLLISDAPSELAGSDSHQHVSTSACYHFSIAQRRDYAVTGVQASHTLTLVELPRPAPEQVQTYRGPVLWLLPQSPHFGLQL